MITAGSPFNSGHLTSEVITKEGRDFLLERLQKIDSGEQLEDMFRAAGMDSGSFHPENFSAREWADVLRAKINKIKYASCSGDRNGNGP